MASFLRSENVKSLRFYMALEAEFLGSFLLQLGTFAILSGNKSTDDSTLKVALSFGLCAASAICIFASTSGGHINPAVSLAFLVARKISVVRFVGYVLFQVAGALAGVLVVKAFVPSDLHGNLGLCLPGKSMCLPQAFGVEFIITYFLVLTVLACVDKNREGNGGSSPLAIGLYIAVAHLLALPLTGSAMNPSRAFAPAVFTRKWTHHWIYWIGPMSAALLAAVSYEFGYAGNASFEKLKSYFKPGYDPDAPRSELQSPEKESLAEVKPSYGTE